MDLRTGKTYETHESAVAAGVPESDIAHVEKRLRDGRPIVKFTKGSFKSFRREDGELVRVS
jgi:hypothetical protein